MANMHDHGTTEPEAASLQSPPHEDHAAGRISEATSQVGSALQEAGRQARKAAASLASDANERVVGLLDSQVEAGASLVYQVAEAVRAAADNLEESSPRLADMVRGAAEVVDDLSDTLGHRSAGDLFYASSDFARRRPALVFGGAAIAGFLLYRVLNAAAASADPAELDGDSVGGSRPAPRNRNSGKRKPARSGSRASAGRRESDRGA